MQVITYTLCISRKYISVLFFKVFNKVLMNMAFGFAETWNQSFWKLYKCTAKAIDKRPQSLLFLYVGVWQIWL